MSLQNYTPRRRALPSNRLREPPPAAILHSARCSLEATLCAAVSRSALCDGEPNTPSLPPAELRTLPCCTMPHEYYWFLFSFFLTPPTLPYFQLWSFFWITSWVITGNRKNTKLGVGGQRRATNLRPVSLSALWESFPVALQYGISVFFFFFLMTCIINATAALQRPCCSSPPMAPNKKIRQLKIKCRIFPVQV